MRVYSSPQCSLSFVSKNNKQVIQFVDSQIDAHSNNRTAVIGK